MGCTGQCSLLPISCWQSVAEPGTRYCFQSIHHRRRPSTIFTSENSPIILSIPRAPYSFVCGMSRTFLMPDSAATAASINRDSPPIFEPIWKYVIISRFAPLLLEVPLLLQLVLRTRRTSRDDELESRVVLFFLSTAWLPLSPLVAKFMHWIWQRKGEIRCSHQIIIIPIFIFYLLCRDGQKDKRRLRELARGSQDAGSRNL